MGKITTRVFSYTMLGEVPEWVKDENVEAWVQTMVAWTGASLQQLRGGSVTFQLVEKDKWEKGMADAVKAGAQARQPGGPKLIS